LRPFGKLRASCGLHFLAASRLSGDMLSAANYPNMSFILPSSERSMG
jgi:hypothetical protein